MRIWWDIWMEEKGKSACPPRAGRFCGVIMFEIWCEEVPHSFKALMEGVVGWI